MYNSKLKLHPFYILFSFLQRWIRSRTFKNDINTAYGIYPENEDIVEMKAVDRNAESELNVAGGGKETSSLQENNYDSMYN